MNCDYNNMQLSQTEDDLFERRRGLPIGNLTNQLFSQVCAPGATAWRRAQKASDRERPRRSPDRRGEMVRRRGAPSAR